MGRALVLSVVDPFEGGLIPIQCGSDAVPPDDVSKVFLVLRSGDNVLANEMRRVWST